MKGIIAEIHGSYMIVIAKNGDFIKCKKLPNCNIGDEVSIPEKNKVSIYKKLSTIAASFLILIMLSTGVYAYYTPYSYVSVDINPSLELYVNRFDKVIGVYAFNEDAQKLLNDSGDIKNKGIDIALTQIIDNAANQGFIKENEENSVMIVVSSNNTKEEVALSKRLGKTSETAMAKVSESYEVILERTKVESFKSAKKENVSPGKVILANELKEVKPEVNEEEIKHMPLQQAIKEIEKQVDTPKKPTEDTIKSAAEPKKPEVKNRTKGNVMNVQQLIKEKNEDLGKKIEENKNKAQDKHKDNDKNNDKSKNNEKNKSNENSKDNDKNKTKEQNKNNSKDNDRDKDDKKQDKSNNKKDTKDNKKDGQSSKASGNKGRY